MNEAYKFSDKILMSDKQNVELGCTSPDKYSKNTGFVYLFKAVLKMLMRN